MKRGFSLVELSIVLVILGLLVGGILAGQSLIRASELRSITMDKNKYETAYQAFRDKYLALPGDMANAYQFFGAAAGCANSVGSANTQGGCNGNGDGQVNLFMGGGSGLPGSNEGWRAWQFMAMAGLIPGTYTGIEDPADGIGSGSYWSFDSAPGINIPATKTTGAGFQFFYIATGGNYSWVAPATVGQYLMVGSSAGNASEVIYGFMKPEDAWNIDKKLDDGIANTGQVYGKNGGALSSDYLAETATMSMLFRI